VPIVAYWPGFVARCIILNFISLSSQIEHISVFGQYSNLFGDFYNNRRSAAKSYLRFTYSFVFLMLRNTIGDAIRTPLIGEAQ
jgi:hypothetical protein